VVGIAIGNEIGASYLSDIESGLIIAGSLRKKHAIPQAPFTSVLIPGPDWIQNTYPPNGATFTTTFTQRLLPLLEALSFNCYGGYFLTPNPPGVNLQNALSWDASGSMSSIIVNQMSALRFSMNAAGVNSKPFWVTETGWSSTITTPKVGQEPSDWSTLKSEEDYYFGFINFNATVMVTSGGAVAKSPDRIFYFGVRDAPHYDNEHFGLFTDSYTLVPKF
jgi:hypothetical protein